MIGSSPAEAPGETWGIGEVGTVASNSWGIVRYTTESGWSPGPRPARRRGPAAVPVSNRTVAR